MMKASMYAAAASLGVTAAALYGAAVLLLARSGEGLLTEGSLLAAAFGALAALLLRRGRRAAALWCALPAALGALVFAAGIICVI